MQHIRNRRLSAFLARRRAKGATLLDLALYVGIAGIIASGSLVAFLSYSNAQKVTTTLNMIGQIQQTVVSLTRGQPDYEGVTTQIVAESRQLPRRFVRAGNTLSNPFNGSTTVATNGGDSRFTIVMTGIPRDACIKLAPTDIGPGVANVQVAPSGSLTMSATPPSNPGISRADAHVACSGTGNAIGWEFYSNGIN
jgi:hypothetical protein